MMGKLAVLFKMEGNNTMVEIEILKKVYRAVTPANYLDPKSKITPPLEMKDVCTQLICLISALYENLRTNFIFVHHRRMKLQASII